VAYLGRSLWRPSCERGEGPKYTSIVTLKKLKIEKLFFFNQAKAGRDHFKV